MKQKTFEEEFPSLVKEGIWTAGNIIEVIPIMLHDGLPFWLIRWVWL